MKMPLTPRDWQLLSDYVDGQLSIAEQKELAERLRVDAGLREGMRSLRLTTTLLRSAPRRRVPHNFTLSPAVFRRTSSGPGVWFALFSLSSAAAALLLMISFAVDLTPRGLPAAVKPLAAEQQTAALEKALPTATPAAGPVILWQPQQGMGGGNIPDGKGGSGSAPAPAMPAPAQVPQPGMLAAATAESKPPAAPPIISPTPILAAKQTALSPTPTAEHPPAGAPARSADTLPTATVPTAAPAVPAPATKPPAPSPSPTATRLIPTRAPSSPTAVPPGDTAATRAAAAPTGQTFSGPILGIQSSTATASAAPKAARTSLPEPAQQPEWIVWLIRLGLLMLALTAGLAAYMIKIRSRR